MKNYVIIVTQSASREIEKIFEYIVIQLKSPKSALKIISEMEETIYSLETMPYRSSERKVGKFKNKGYFQIFVKNYTIIYRINEKDREVIIVTVQYSHSNF